MKKPKQWSASGCAYRVVMIATLLIASVVCCRADNEPQLLSRSHVVFDLHAAAVVDDSPMYFWRSRDELLLIKFANTDYYAYKINCSTGKVVRARALNRLLASEQYNFISDLELSPNGRTLLMPLYRNYKYQIEMFDLNTGAHRFLPPQDGHALSMQLLWEPDGKHWLEMLSGLNQPWWDVDRHSTLMPGTTYSRIPDTGVVGVNLAGNLMACIDDPVSKTIQHLITYNLRTGAVISNVPLATPAGAHVGSVALSPKCDRIFIEVDYSRDPNSSSSPSLNPFAPRGSQLVRSAIWVCGIDGKGMHEVGSVPIQFSMSSALQADWLPDGKSISFLHQHKLWVAPAE